MSVVDSISWPTHMVPFPPSGTTVEDAGRPVPLVPTPDPFASVNMGFSGRTEELLSVHENGLEKALGSCTHCGNMKRSVNKPKDTPPHLPDTAAVNHTHFHITIHCWHLLKPFSTQELVECSDHEERQMEDNKIMKYSLCYQLPALV